MIYSANRIDIPKLCNAMREYLAESRLGVEFSWANTEATFLQCLDEPTSGLWVVDGEGGELAAFALVTIDHSLTVKPTAILSLFYVCPAYRGTTVARRLLAHCCHFADNAGCTHMFASASAQLEGQASAMFANLCKKSGFRATGPCLVRSST